MREYFNCHTHTMYSNIRLVDCINRPKDLINKAIELGMSGLAITDHECLSAHMEVNQYAKEIKEKYPNFKIALGNEIYLTDTRDKGQKYYHFILIAKNAEGHRALREMSSTAWYNSYEDRRMERVPLLKEEMAKIMLKYKGSVIATTACMGGELSTLAQKLNNTSTAEELREYENKIIEFIQYCKDIFQDDFYIECAPSSATDQIAVNRKLKNIASFMDVPMVVGTDAHYLTSNERPVHKAYLNSKDGDREVDSFYEFAHLMDSDEVIRLLKLSFNDIDFINQILDTTITLQNKIEDYSLERKQIVPKVKVKDYPRMSAWEYDMFPTIRTLLTSDNPQERYWINECLIALSEKNLDGEWNYVERLETEADIIKFIGEQLNDCLFAYFNTFKHYIDLFWECGSIVGPGRGSATGFLSNYLLGITQLDPVRWNINYWRFLNKERAELPDIDIDLAPSRRPAIFQAIREERGEFGLVQVATFGTEAPKSAIQAACRGYRSEDFPNGIDVDEALYISSLIPQERGFLWSIHEVVYGNEEKGRKPIIQFIKEMEKYPGLLDIVISIEGLVNKRGIHASGVMLYGADPFETASFMRAPNGDLITCYDLHRAEAAGDTKYDFLVTEISDKIIKCLELLQKDNLVESIPLRSLYNKYLHPEVIDTTNPDIWTHLAAGDVLDVFQFSTGVGLAIAKKLKPQNPLEMTAANAIMRLMSEPGKESQQDRYVRIQKQGLKVFEQEMRQHGLPDEVRKVFHKHCDSYWGCCPIQEQVMSILMDAAHFTLAEANGARKIIAKKQMNKIPELKTMVTEKVGDARISDYIWETSVAPQLGYAFSFNHSLPYSFVGVQSIILATQFNPIYWNTACLIVNSGATEQDNGGSTDYGKIAKAIGDILSAGIKVSLADINKSDFGFIPDAINNQIIFGLKGMLNVGDDVIATIISNRPYTSPRDFINKVQPGKQTMVALIKGGAFDNMLDRKICMAWYLWENCDKKSRLTLQNMPSLIKYNLLPEDTEEQIMARRVFEFNRYLKATCKHNDKYLLDERASSFLDELGVYEKLINHQEEMNAKDWDKEYQKWMDIFRNWISEDKESILKKLNEQIFKEEWMKYGKGNISSWEMEVLCFYSHEHELSGINKEKYGIVNFFALPENPIVEKTFSSRYGTPVNIFKLNKIAGTCIAKNKTKGIVTLLTEQGVVNVKFRTEYFANFDKQISERRSDGTKKVVEKSWFNRGNMLVIQGIRSGDEFIPKKYASSTAEQLYKITSIDKNGDLTLTHTRYQGGIEEDV